MAKKTKPEDDTLLDVGEVYTKTERFVDENRSTLTYGVGGLAVLILAVIGYQSFVVGPAEAAAETDAWRAENYFEMDSMSLAALGDGYAAGLEEVMADHEGTAAGQRAAYRMGIYYRDAGDFEGAIAAFEEVNVGDDVVQVLAAGNIGDCYVELADYESAQAPFNKPSLWRLPAWLRTCWPPCSCTRVHSLKSSWATTPKPKSTSTASWKTTPPANRTTPLKRLQPHWPKGNAHGYCR